jgi:hypothetical protein
VAARGTRTAAGDPGNYLDGVSFDPNAAAKIAFHQSLSEAALSRTAGQNDRLPALAADPVRRP